MYNNFLTTTFSKYNALLQWYENLNEDLCESLVNAFDIFSKDIIFKRKRLWHNIIKGNPFKIIKRIKEYKSYVNITDLMIDEIYNIINDWKTTYANDLVEQTKLTKEEAIMDYKLEKARSEHIVVKGFGEMMPKKKRKYTKKKKNGNKN